MNSIGKMIAEGRDFRILDQDITLQCSHDNSFYFYCECCGCEHIKCNNINKVAHTYKTIV